MSSQLCQSHVALAYRVFGDIIDIWTWIGAIVIFGAAVYIAHREVLLKRKPEQVELIGPPLLAGFIQALIAMMTLNSGQALAPALGLAVKS